jgi:hypothetical protein
VEMLLGAGEGPECADERKARELVRQIRKLRWLGMFSEARSLETAISQIPAGESVLLLPPSTD